MSRIPITIKTIRANSINSGTLYAASFANALPLLPCIVAVILGIVAVSMTGPVVITHALRTHAFTLGSLTLIDLVRTSYLHIVPG